MYDEIETAVSSPLISQSFSLSISTISGIALSAIFLCITSDSHALHTPSL